jgi:aryl-alcohol dehydrogenase-like predicted oxidoreductase
MELAQDLNLNKNPFYTELGQTGILISRLGLGTVKFGRNQQVKNFCGDGFTLPNEKEVQTLLETALENGVNFIDTAPAYGSSEIKIGVALKNSQILKRDKLAIFSKTGETFIEGNSAYDFSEKATITSVHNSLKNLGTDYLDGVFVHSHREDLAVIIETPVLETLNRLKQQGKIRSYGVSTMSVAGGLKSVELSDYVMVSYNQAYDGELAVIEAAISTNKGVIVKKGFCSGKLIDNFSPESCLRSIFKLGPTTAVTVGTINSTHLINNINTAKQILV